MYLTATIPGRRKSRKIEAKKSRLPKKKWSARSRVQSLREPSPSPAKVEYSCAYSCLMCYCEIVICMEFLLQKNRPRANIKKTAKTISILRNERFFTSLPKIVYFKYFSRFSVTTTTTSASMASLKKNHRHAHKVENTTNAKNAQKL